MNADAKALQKTFRDLAESDCEDLKAWERLIDERRAAPWHNKALPRPWHWQFGNVWRGEASDRRALDVYCQDCGLGDLFMLAGAVRLASLQVAKVRLHLDPRMRWLVPRLFGDRVEAVTESQVVAPTPGWHCSPMDLPGALGVGATVIGKANEAHRRKAPGAEAVAYGLACSPHYFDQDKAPQSESQKVSVCAELGNFAHNAIYNIGEPRIGEERNAFSVTLQLIRQARGFIGVDSAAAHVAAWAGVPTVIMLHERPNWRWGSYVGKQSNCPVPPWYGPHVRAVSWVDSWRSTAYVACKALDRLAPHVEASRVAAI